jgi:hypothetical protein
LTEATVAHSTQRLSESPGLPAQAGAVKPLSADRFSVNFTADNEFHSFGCSEASKELLEEVRALNGHAEPKGDLLNVMKRGLEALRSELLKKRFGVGRKPRRARLSPSETASRVGRFETHSSCRSR